MPLRSLPILAVALFAAGASAQGAASGEADPAGAPVLPAPPGARVATLTPAPGFFTEPSIAVDPRDPSRVVGAYQDNVHAAWSDDAGRSWHPADGTAPPGFRVSGDVSVTFDAEGHAILCYIAFDKLGTTDYWAHDATRNGIFTRRSLDGGKTWESRDVPVKAFEASRPGIPFEDKPLIVADVSRGPYRGTLYVGWTEFRLDSTVILLSRSTDDGRSWSPAARISTRAGLPRDDNGAVEGFTGAIGPDGTLYVAWTDGGAIVFTTSKDGGRTFAPSRPVIATAPAYFKAADVARANGFPQLAIDPRAGARGRLWVTWSDYRNGDIDVFASTSTDGGAHWTPAARVNDDPVHDGADQFFQWLAVDPRTGAANVLFYDRRADPANRRAVMVLARSTDGGRSFANYRWTDAPFEPGDVFIGDYTGIAALDGRVYGIWTEVTPVPPGDSAARRRPHTIVRTGVADFGAR